MDRDIWILVPEVPLQLPCVLLVLLNHIPVVFMFLVMHQWLLNWQPSRSHLPTPVLHWTWLPFLVRIVILKIYISLLSGQSRFPRSLLTGRYLSRLFILAAILLLIESSFAFLLFLGFIGHVLAYHHEQFLAVGTEIRILLGQSPH